MRHLISQRVIRTPQSLLTLALLFAVCFLRFEGVASAADRYWISTAGSANWNSNLNWSATSGGGGGAGVPGAADHAIFDAGGTANCNVNISVTISSVTISTAATGSYNGTLDTQNFGLTLSKNFIQNSGTFNANSSTITISTQFTINGGTYNANTSSMTVSGDTTLMGGTFNAGGSTLTLTGNWTRSSGNTFNAGSSDLCFSGAGAQTVNSSTATYFQIEVTNASAGGVDFRDSFTVSTFTATTANSLIKIAPTPAVMAVTKYLNLNGQAKTTQVLLRSETTGSTWQLNRSFIAVQSIRNANIQDSDATWGSAITATDPSNTDNGNNSNWNFGVSNRYWVAPSLGVWSDPTNWSTTSGGAGGAPVPGGGNDVIFDGGGVNDCAVDVSVYARSLTISTSTLGGFTGIVDAQGNALTLVQGFTQNNGTFFGRASVISVGGDWSRAPGATFTPGTSKVSFNGTAAQSVNSSSATYYQVDIANASSGGVSFNDTLTVSTFSALIPNALAKFAVNTASMTVKTYFNLNGQATHTQVKLRSLTDGTSWQLVLSTGITQSIKNTNPKDSNASKGIAANGADASNTDSGNNTYWTFPAAINRYWVASGPGVWSDSANWSNVSGGPNGFSPPGSSQNAVFDANGQGNCTIDTTISIASMTISTATGGGYLGTIDTSSNTITLTQNFLQNGGTFNAGSSSVTVNGTFILSGGTFNAGTSTEAIAGGGNMNGGTLNCSSSTFIFTGNNTFDPQFKSFWDVIIAGTNTFTRSWTTFNTLNITGTLTLNNNQAFTAPDGSTTTILGTLTASGSNGVLYVTDGAMLGTGGTITAPVTFQSLVKNVTVPARTYGGTVTILNQTGSNFSAIPAPGSHIYNGGLIVQEQANGNMTYNASVNNPAVTVTTITFSQASGGNPILNAGSGVWTVSSLITVSSGTFNANTANITVSSSVVVASNGIFNANSSTLTVAGPFTLSTGTLNTNTAVINISSTVFISSGGVFNAGTGGITLGGLTQSSGTFSGNTASMTVTGDVNLNGGVYNAGGSTLTLVGNWTMANTFAFNANTGTVNLIGSGKTFNAGSSGGPFWNINVPGNITAVTGGGTNAGVLNVSGTLTLNASWGMSPGSTVTISGTIGGASSLFLNGNITLGTGGILNAPVVFRYGMVVPARVYGGLVTINDQGALYTKTAAAGTHTYNGGLTFNNAAPFFDAAANNPTIIATSVTVQIGGTRIWMGSGTWQVANTWNVTDSTITQGAGGILRLNGTGQQDIYSSSNTYFRIDDVNTSAAGVRFRDSFSVSTFTALSAGSTIQFQMLPSSLTVTGYLGLGPVSGSKVSLRSASGGTTWGLRVVNGSVMSIRNVDVADSDASSGTLVIAGDGSSTDSGNNLNWTFTPIVRYWVKNGGIAGVWSDPNNWSLSSGGGGGAGIPQPADPVVFDGNGTANCTIDQTVLISSLTISSVTAGGYTGTINASTNSIAIANSFTISTGTFNAMGSTMTIGGSVTQNAGIFNAGASSAVVSGDVVQNGGTADLGTCNWTVGGNFGGLFSSNAGTTFTFTGIGKTITPHFNLFNVNIVGNVICNANFFGNINVSGACIAGSSVIMQAVSTLTVTGTGSLSGQLTLTNNAVNFNPGSVINSAVGALGNFKLPAYTYGGTVSVGQAGYGYTVTLGAGTFNFNGGLIVTNTSAATVLDASVNNPAVTASALTFATNGPGSDTVNAGSGTWTFTAPVSLTTGTFNANSATIVFQSSVTISAGAVFNAGTALITFSTAVLQSTGTFNANNSSITVNGDVNLNGGTFNAGGSTITAMGNWGYLPANIFNYNTSHVILSGAGKTLSNVQETFWKLTVPGSITSNSNAVFVAGILDISGSLTAAPGAGVTLLSGSMLTMSDTGSLIGNGFGSVSYLQIYGPVSISTSGILNIPINIRATPQTLSARTYGGTVAVGYPFNNGATVTLGSGTFAFNGGLYLNGSAVAVLDGSLNNPNVTVTTLTLVNAGVAPLLKTGSGTWTVNGSIWDLRGGALTQGTGGVLRFNGTGQQDVYSSSNTYFQIDDANTSALGVRFHDSLTVSTFTALQGGTTIQFAVKPSSLTVTSYLGLGSAISTTTVSMRSAVYGSQWGLRLLVGSTTSVVRTDVQDSDASGGAIIYATSGTNVDNGNNTAWVFTSTTSITHYWVASSPANWSNPSAWAFSSGGAGGSGVPLPTDAVVFDGNGLGMCTIDTAISISTLTVSSITAGGYTGTINASSNSITLSNGFTLSTGTFNAMGSTITVGGDTAWTGGVFNAGSSSLTLQGHLGLTTFFTFNFGSSVVSLTGSNKIATVPFGSGPGLNFWTLNVPGSITTALGFGFNIYGTLNISGTLAQNSGSLSLVSGSTLTLSGILNGVNPVNINPGVIVGTGGTINAPTSFVCSVNQYIPSRTFNGSVKVSQYSGAPGNGILGAGNANFAGGLTLQSGNGPASITLDASVNNPSVAITTLTYTYNTSALDIINAGSGNWTIQNALTLTTGTFNANSATIVFQSSVTISTGAVFNVNTAQVTFSTSVLMSSGTFNAGTSSITVLGDMLLNNGIFNAGGSTITVAGNLTVNNGFNLPFNPGTSNIILSGSGKTFTLSNNANDTFYSMSIPGTINTFSGSPNFNGILTVDGALTIANGLTMNIGSVLNVTGTIGGNPLTINSGATLGTGGILNSAVIFWTGPSTIPARVYNGLVTFLGNAETFAGGTHTYNGGLKVGNGGGVVTLDASVNNPIVNVNGPVSFGGGAATENIKMGSGLWTVAGIWDMRANVGQTTSVIQSTGGILRLNGTGLQDVYASSSTYFAIDNVNTSTSGVRFHDSLTVSTFTALQGGTTIQFAVNPSSLTVTSYLGLGSAISTMTVSMRSAVYGSQWGLRLLVGSTTSVVRTDVQDSDASGGAIIYATSGTNVDNGNNTAWVFTSTTSITHYWVASSPANWSNPSAWAFSSGGAGGSGVPLPTDAVVFDGNGLGMCTIDTAVSISTLTLSSVTAGGYTGTINTSSNPITISNDFIMSTGTFNAMGSTITLGGNAALNGGVFNGGVSTMTVAGNWTFGSIALAFNLDTNGVTLSGAGKTLTPAGSNQRFGTLIIAGSISNIGGFTIANTLYVPGTLTTVGGFTMNSGSTLTVSGTINGSSSINLNDVVGISPGGTINSPLAFTGVVANTLFIPARTYTATVTAWALSANTNFIMGPGTHNYTAGVIVRQSNASAGILNGSVNNPTVNVTTLTFTQSGANMMTVNAGAGPWTFSGPITLTTGTFNANTATIVFQSSVTLSTGAVFNANAAQVTFSSHVYQSTGTFNMNASSITIAGDLTLMKGTWNAGVSTLTLSGHVNDGTGSNVFVSSAGMLVLNGNNKTMVLTSVLNNLTISGNITSDYSINLSALSKVNVPGTLTISNSAYSVSTVDGSTVTLSGTINGPGSVTITGNATLGTGGTLNAPVIFNRTCSNPASIPARTYNGLVTASQTCGGSVFMLPGTHIYNNGLRINGGGGTIKLDAGISSPTVTLYNGFSSLPNGNESVSLGSGLWTLGSGNWDVRNTALTQTTGGVLRFAGTGQQKIYSSSNTYYAIDVVNVSTNGVQFQDSLTVSTFTALQGGTTLQFAVKPSSLTVTGYLGLGPAVSGSMVSLRSAVAGSQWALRLPAGSTTSIVNTNVQDSDASGGLIVYATSGTNVDSGNNASWVFTVGTSLSRYWVASTASNWSNAGNWSLTSGGVGGSGAPLSGDSVLFDGNGQGNCAIDTTLNLSTFTLSTSTTGGYGGIVNTQNNAVTLTQGFVLNRGTFTAGSSQIVIGGTMTINGGVFNAGTSTTTVLGNVAISGASNYIAGMSRFNLAADANFTPSSAKFWNLTISSTTNLINSVAVESVFNVPGTLNMTGYVSMGMGSTTTLSGTLNGPGVLVLSDLFGVFGTPPILGTGGTINAPVQFDLWASNVIIPARTYNGAVTAVVTGGGGNLTALMGAGSHIYNGGLNMYSGTGAAPTGVLDGATNNPNVTVNGNLVMYATAVKAITINAGAGTWTVNGNMTLSTGTFNANTSSVGITGVLTLSSATLNANSAHFTVGSLTQSSGTFNGQTSSITVMGDTVLNGGAFNADGSSITLGGDVTIAPSLAWNYGVSVLNLTGTSKTLNLVAGGPAWSLWNLTIPGSITSSNRAVYINGLLNVSGTLTVGSEWAALSGSTVTVSGTLNSTPGNTFYVIAGGALGGAGVLNTSLSFYGGNPYACGVPARTFNGPVTIQASGPSTINCVLGSGSAAFSGGLTIQAAATTNATLDATANSPSVTVTTITYIAPGTGVPMLKAGDGTWTFSGDVDLRKGQFSQGASGLIQLNGVNQQNVYSSSATYSRMDITNTSSGGVLFRDSLTVATFTALSAGTSLQFAVNPSSLTVTGVFSMGPSSGAKATLRSLINGTRWGLRLPASAAQTVRFVDAKDSDASGGAIILADNASSTDSGNNVNWQFNPITVTKADIAPASALQGSEVAVSSFTLTAASAATFQAIRLRRTGVGPDGDVQFVRLYRESGGTAGFQPAQDSLVVQTDSNVFVNSAGAITITNSPPQAIGVSPVSYYVVYQLNPNFIGSLADSVGVRISSATDLSFMNGAALTANFPITSSLTAIDKLIDTMTVTATSLNDPSIARGTNNIAFAKLQLAAARDRTFWSALRVNRLGSGPDNDVSGISVWKDGNGDGLFDPGTDSLVSSGNDSLFAGLATVALSSQTIPSGGQIYFLTANIAAGASIGDTIGFRIAVSTDVVLLAPDVVDVSGYPIDTALTTVAPAFNILTLSTGAFTSAPTLQQGTTNAMQLITFSVDTGNAIWDALSISQIGTAVQSDLNTVLIYRDNGDSVFQAGVDTRVSVATMTFDASGLVTLTLPVAETVIGGVPKSYWIVAKLDPSANIGATVQTRVTNASAVRLQTLYTTVTGNFPLLSSESTISPTIDTLSVTPSDLTPATVLQAATDVTTLKLSLISNSNTVGVFSVKVDRTGNGADGDISALRIYKDNGNGAFGGAGEETLVTSGNDVLGNGSATLFFNSTQFVNTSTSVYFVMMDVSGSAQVGRTIGLSVGTTNYITVTSPDLVSTANFPMPNPVAPAVITKQVATVQISTSNLAPAGVDPGTNNQAMIRFTLSTNRNIATWTQLKMDRIGANNTDVPSARLYYDSNNNGVFESSIDQLISNTVNFDGSNQAILPLTITQTLTTAPRRYFVAVNVSSNAVPGDTFKLRWVSNSYVTVNAPDLVSNTMFPIDTAQVTVNEPPSTLTFVPSDMAPAAVAQDSQGVLMASFTMVTDRYAGSWTRLRVDRAGSGADGDVVGVKLYVDDGNGSFGGEDTLITSGNDAFTTGSANLVLTTQTITTTPKRYFLVYDVSAGASANKTLGASIGSSGFFTVTSPDIVAFTHLPFSTGLMLITPTVDTLTVSPTNLAPNLTQGASQKAVGRMTMSADNHAVVWTSLRVDRSGGADSDLLSVALYADTGDSLFDASQDTLVTSGANFFTSGASILNLLAPQTITTAANTYFLVVSVSSTATVGATLQFTVGTSSYVSVNSPDLVAATNFPLVFTSGGSINDLPDTLTVSLSTAATAEMYQGTARYAFAKVTLQANQDQVLLSQLALSQYGTGADTDVSSVQLYFDTDGSGDFAAATDTAVTPAASLSGSVITLVPTTPLTITSTPRTYFLVGDISATAGVGNTLGFRLSASNGVQVSNPDTVISANLPTQAPLGQVLNPHVPRMPLITINNTYSSSPTRLSASWSSSVPIGSITEFDYAIGTTAGGVDVVPFTSAGIATSVTRTGLLLSDGQRYYFSIKAQSDTGLWSAVALSTGILVDSQKPLPPTGVTTFIDGDSVILTWTPASTGPSGVSRYLTYIRPGSSPQATLAGTTTVTAGALPIFSAAPSYAAPFKVSGLTPSAAARSGRASGVVVTSLTPGTYYFSIRTMSNAGLLSDASPETRVLLGVDGLPAAVSSVTNYPNPFDSRRGVTTINYTLNADMQVDIKIYDVFGGKVKSMTFASGQTGGVQGSNNVTWDGTDESGVKVSKGIYLCVVGGSNKVTIKIGVQH